MLTVAYDGTCYNGWQIQPGVITIESVLNETLTELLHEDIKVIGAQRTDSGVHAEGAVCVFDTDSTIPGDRFCFALNPVLPDDIRIRASREVEADFHPRRVPCKKTYRYRIWNDAFSLPTNSRYTHLVHTELDVKKMAEAAEYLIGTHDFKSFCSAGSQAETTVRTIYDIKITKTGKEIDIDVTGNGFLYNMVRIIAGTLTEAGRGKITPSDMEGILESKDRSMAGLTAPAKGLTLLGYEWKQDVI